MSVEIQSLTKKYGSQTVIDGLTTNFEAGKFSVLLGPSGCGKTTTLRCIAGLEQPTSGTICIDSQTVFSDRDQINLPVERRDLGMVFQSYAIWPHMTVFENVALPLRARGVKVPDLDLRVEEVLALVGLAGMRARSATQLSGGQQQRVAIARCIVSRPRLMLFDEPLSNLDAKLRLEMRRDLRDLQRLTGATVLFVTHDQEEALSLADTIYLFRNGRIVQHGDPIELYRRPCDRYVAEFLGKANLFQVKVETCGEDRAVFTSAGHHRIGGSGDAQYLELGSHLCLVRPESWNISGNEAGLPGRIISATFLGDRTEYIVSTSLGDQTVKVSGFNTNAPNETVFMNVQPGQLHIFKAADALSIE